MAFGLSLRLGLGAPPVGARAIQNDSLRPKLVRGRGNQIDVDLLDLQGPEAPAACLVLQVTVRSSGPPENTGARTCDDAAAVGRPETIRGSGDERLDARNIHP